VPASAPHPKKKKLWFAKPGTSDLSASVYALVAKHGKVAKTERKTARKETGSRTKKTFAVFRTKIVCNMEFPNDTPSKIETRGKIETRKAPTSLQGSRTVPQLQKSVPSFTTASSVLGASNGIGGNSNNEAEQKNKSPRQGVPYDPPFGATTGGQVFGAHDNNAKSPRETGNVEASRVQNLKKLESEFITRVTAGVSKRMERLSFANPTFVDPNGQFSFNPNPRDPKELQICALVDVRIFWRRGTGSTIAAGHPLFEFELIRKAQGGSEGAVPAQFGSKSRVVVSATTMGFSRNKEDEYAVIVSSDAAYVQDVYNQAAYVGEEQSNDESSSSYSCEELEFPPRAAHANARMVFVWPEMEGDWQVVTVSKCDPKGTGLFRTNELIMSVGQGEGYLSQGLVYRIERQVMKIHNFLNSRVEEGLRDSHSIIEADPPIEPSDAAEAAERLDSLLKDFHSAVEVDARKIVEEDSVPEDMRSVRRRDQVGGTLGGILGGEKFIANGILYKFLGPKGEVSEFFRDAGEREMRRVLHKIPGADLKGYCGVFHFLWTKGMFQKSRLRTAYQVLVDYSGFRVLAQVLLPIAKEETLVFGSADGGRTFASGKSARVERHCDELGKFLGLAEHDVTKHDVTNAVRTRLAADVEVHEGRDLYQYLIDLNRLLPPLPLGQGSNIGLVYSRHFRKEVVAFLAEKTGKFLNADVFTKFSRNAEESKMAVTVAAEWMRVLIMKRVPQAAFHWIIEYWSGESWSPCALSLKFSYCLRKFGLNQSMGGLVLTLVEFMGFVRGQPPQRVVQSLDAMSSLHPVLREVGELWISENEDNARQHDDGWRLECFGIGARLRKAQAENKRSLSDLIRSGRSMLLARQLKFELRFLLQKQPAFENRRLVARDFLVLIGAEHLLPVTNTTTELEKHFSCSKTLAEDICATFLADAKMNDLVLELLLSFEVVKVDHQDEFLHGKLWRLLQPGDVFFPVRLKTSGLDVVARALKDLARLTQLRSSPETVVMYDLIGKEVVELLLDAVARNPADAMVQSTLGSVYAELWRGRWQCVEKLLRLSRSSSDESMRAIVDECKLLVDLFDKATAAFCFGGDLPATLICAVGLRDLMYLQERNWRRVMDEAPKHVVKLLRLYIRKDMLEVDERLEELDALIKKESGSVKQMAEDLLDLNAVSVKVEPKPVSGNKIKNFPTSPIMLGLLSKKGPRVMTGYKERFFVLVRGRLIYGLRLQNDDTGADLIEELGNIKLVAGTVVSYEDGNVTFKIKPSDCKRVFKLQGSSDQDAKRWVDAIKSVVELEQKNAEVIENLCEIPKETIKLGFLSKRGEDVIGKFKDRFFVLLPNKLIYGEKHGKLGKTEIVQRGSISLMRGTVVKKKKKSMVRFVVAPADSNRRYTIEAVSAEECDSWVNAILATILKNK
jgi:hypothetical protein